MMRSIFSSRRQSTIQSSSKSESVALPLPPQKPPEAENQNSQNMNQEKTKNKMPKMEVFASKLEETCRSLLTRVGFIFKDFWRNLWRDLNQSYSRTINELKKDSKESPHGPYQSVQLMENELHWVIFLYQMAIHQSAMRITFH